jgi:putative membrane protein insertion efficiency factor
MKHVLLFTITIYQKIVSPLINQLFGFRAKCRYQVTCSAYAKDMIQKHGIINGMRLAVVRFMHCQPFSKPYAIS